MNYLNMDLQLGQSINAFPDYIKLKEFVVSEIEKEKQSNCQIQQVMEKVEQQMWKDSTIRCVVFVILFIKESIWI